jgi:pimeloyl-ACP methyl ester carboxylesterase
VRVIRAVGLLTLALLLSAAMLATAVVVSRVRESDDRQQALAAFYQAPDPLPATPGTLLRREPLGVEVPGATAWRILYVSERPDGTPTPSGGMLFVPDGPPPPGGRPVVAWAHGTLGLGDACAPSRSANPLRSISQWVTQMVGYGWVVVATDYVGVGTAGPTFYLIGESEARDVTNSVRAARQVPEAGAGRRWVAYGHSQGGHSALWTGHLAPELAPELELLGVAAAAPAAELPAIVHQQWDQVVAWVIGPDVAQDWPAVYPDLPIEGVVSPTGQGTTSSLAADCLQEAGLTALARTYLGQRYFQVDPLSVASWRSALEAQQPPPLPDRMPVFLAQGTADEVVLADTNALMQRRWCDAGSGLQVEWLGTVTHDAAAAVAGPAVAAWAFDLFAGEDPVPDCAAPPPPVAPYDAGAGAEPR